MAHSQLEGRAPLKGASAMRAYVPVAFVVAGAASQLSETVLPAGSVNDYPFGITSATVATAGDPISYWQRGDVAKCVAGASIGAGALLGIGSTNGILIPLSPSGLSTALGSAIGAQGLRWAVGIALKNAAAADLFPVAINPQQII